MIPAKPFDTYKWRWLHTQPTESLLNPPVFLGVLRVLARHENASPSDPAIARELSIVESETNSPVNLARTTERNIIRNSGQYWKGTGLLVPDRGTIHLTALGRKVAQGLVTQAEFASIMIQQTTLPNPSTYKPEEIEKWRQARLEIKPFVLLLEILGSLRKQYEHGNAYITANELIRIIIPLAGVKEPAAKIAKALYQHRNGQLDISGWPDCAPQSNDKRLAREFLLFLANYGICRRAGGTNMDEKYFLDQMVDAQELEEITTASIFENDQGAETVIEAVRHSDIPSIIERQRTVTTVMARTGQAKFRSSVLKAFRHRCFLTGDTIPEVLEAAHIIPVNQNGADTQENGLCLRVDIHRLFDSGNIRLKPSGELFLSEAANASENYTRLPRRVEFPAFIKPANIEWREKYC